MDLSAPTGEFFLAEGTNPVVLVSAGIGITPVMAMLQDILAKNPQRPVTFLHVARSTENFALMNEVRQCMPKLTNGKCGVYLTQAKEGDGKCTCFKFGRPDAAAVAALAPTADADVYICGPVDFMKSMSLAFAAAGVPAEQIHTEAFGTGNQS